MPEYLLATLATALLGWGTFTLKRTEDALVAARVASDQIDKLELKVAENYLTKKEFEASMGRVFHVLDRLETKMDDHADRHESHLCELRDHLDKTKN